MLARTFNHVVGQRALWILALLVGLWLTASPLLACPYMTQGPACCPADAHHHMPAKCPFSKSVKNCPVYASETRLGLVEGKVDAAPDPVTATTAPSLPATLAAAPLEVVWLPSGVGLLHRVHVLRI